jgi:hypothetical protein
MKKRDKKLQLNRETIANLHQIKGAAVAFRQIAPEGDIASAGPAICYISDCNPCETTVYADAD